METRKMLVEMDKMHERLTGGLAQAGGYRRGKCSGKMNVSSPHELYRTPRLRQAARTLAASGRDSGRQQRKNLKIRCYSKTKKPR